VLTWPSGADASQEGVMSFEIKQWKRAAGRTAASVVTVAALFGLFTYGTGTPTARADATCRQVSGSISANAITNPNVSTGLALGNVTGGLAGATMATFTVSAGSGGSLNLLLHHNFVTRSRDSLNTSDTGVLIPVPGLANIYRMSVNYTITGGTGKFAGATGNLQNHGEADLQNGLLTLTYSGQVCSNNDW
jgi:hypothetical protein